MTDILKENISLIIILIILLIVLLMILTIIKKKTTATITMNVNKDFSNKYKNGLQSSDASIFNTNSQNMPNMTKYNK